MTGEFLGKTISTLEKMSKLGWNNVNRTLGMRTDPAVGIDLFLVIIVGSRTTGTSTAAYTNVPSPDHHLHALEGTPVPPLAYLTVLKAQLSLGESFMQCKGIYPISVNK